MKTLVLYYSWSGNTEALAKDRAVTEGADLYAVRDMKPPGRLAAYTAGCLAALRRKRTPILPLSIDLKAYERIIIMAPIWAGKPAPAINNVFDLLPQGKEVSVTLVSGSGSSNCGAHIRALVEARGCTLLEVENRKA